MHQFLEQLVNGIQLGSIYALIALGYTMVYGVLKLINFAHGDVYMVGAYAGMGSAFALGVWLPAHSGLAHLLPSPGGALLVLLLSMAVCALLGLIIEQAAYRPLRTRAWIAPAIFLGAAGGYVAYGIAQNAHAPLAVSILAGVLVWASLAVLLRTTQRRRVAGAPSRLTALITAIGVSLFLENFGVLKQVFSSEQQIFPNIVTLVDPQGQPLMAHLGPLSVAWQTILIFGLSLVLMGVLTWIITRTKMGKAIRAVSFDADAASLMGINTDRVIAFTFALGASLAGAAGVMVPALTHEPITPYIGIQFGLKAFVAAVFGGIGNIPGAMLGGLIMGIAENLVSAYGLSTYRDAVAFLLLIVILLVRPAGLLGKFAPEKV